MLVTGEREDDSIQLFNEDTKDEEGKESWSTRNDPYIRCHTPSPPPR